VTWRVVVFVPEDKGETHGEYKLVNTCLQKGSLWDSVQHEGNNLNTFELVFCLDHLRRSSLME